MQYLASSLRCVRQRVSSVPKSFTGIRMFQCEKKNVQFVRSEFLTYVIVYLNSNVYPWLWFGTGCYVFMCEM